MAQDPSKMTRTPRATHSMGFPRSSDPERLRQQIADTRAGMTDTLDALHDRVNPRNIMNRTMESMKESTMSRVRNLADSVGSAAGYVMARTQQPRERLVRVTKKNPIPAAVIGAAAMWIVVRAIRNGRRREYLYEEAL
jgi:dihydroneopterin aldolase